MDDPGLLTITLPSSGETITGPKRLTTRQEQAIQVASKPPALIDGQWIRVYDSDADAYEILVQFFISPDTESSVRYQDGPEKGRFVPRTRAGLESYTPYEDINAAKFQCLVAFRPQYFVRLNGHGPQQDTETDPTGESLPAS